MGPGLGYGGGMVFAVSMGGPMGDGGKKKRCVKGWVCR